MISHTQSDITKRQGGFTLIELMVVSIVIILITSMIALKLNPGGSKPLKEEARRMNALVRLASEQALLQGRDIGLKVENNGYSFYLYDLVQQRWISLGQEKLFRARTLPKTMRMELSVEESDVTWPTPEEDEDEDDAEDDDFVPTPQVLMLSSGEITPFDLYFEMDKVDAAFQLAVYADGTREVVELEHGF